ncbi:hypothetical protein FRB96_006938 [Tulasnella sp. 330]|nr:hypothetical protein FRB96_006938 [Tulasnella sp. 330]KAG8876561.1 hypothetical protein FRB97_004114 [Tulasnella sp. 331]KAG8889840.1 hypothetical protein FRB98_002489 [Tulasnella sp. 332]
MSHLLNSSIRFTKLPPGFKHEIRHHLESPKVPKDSLTGVSVLDFENYCCGAHGLSVLIDTVKDGESHRAMFDTGPEHLSIARNLASLDISLHNLETVVLSHWHSDHSGGILEALKTARNDKLKAKESTSGMGTGATATPVAVDLHPSRPIARGIAPPPYDKVMARLNADPSFEEIEECGGTVSLHAEAHTISNGAVYVSGEIPRVTPFEQGLLGATRWVDASDPRETVGPTRNGGKWVNEPHIMDERYVAIDVLGKGLIILSACSHAGICNVVEDAVAKLQRPIYMIIGGLHLASDDLTPRIAPTVHFLSKSLRPAPTYVLPMHCTGFNAKIALEAALGEGCVPAGTGISVLVQGDAASENMVRPPVISHADM